MTSPEPQSDIIATIRTDMVEWIMPAYKAGDTDHPAMLEFEHDKALAVLLANEIVMLNDFWWREDLPADLTGIPSLSVICNDVFAWGSADAERLTYRGIKPLYKMWRKDPAWGPAVWCIKQRNRMPQKPVEDAIRKAGIWELDTLGVGPNTQTEQIRAWFAEWCAAEPTPNHVEAWCPTGTDIATLVKVEGHRWAIEDSFETAKNEFGLDHNETRSYHGWHRHVSLVMLVFAMMAVIRHKANQHTHPKKQLQAIKRRIQ